MSFVTIKVEDEESYIEREEKRKAKQHTEDIARRDLLNKRRDETKQFNESLNIPFSWRTGYKDVLSGLSGISWGDGTNQATVGHIEFLEEHTEGRLKRIMSDFLCTAKIGKQWSGSSHLESLDGDGNSYNARVTCRSCIKSAKRWASTK